MKNKILFLLLCSVQIIQLITGGCRGLLESIPPAYNGKIAFVVATGAGYEIYLLDCVKNNILRLTNNEYTDSYPVFSPDGSKIAFESDRDYFAGEEIYLMDADGKNQVRLTYTNPLSRDRSPVFTHDGSKIVFVSNRDGVDNQEIYSMDITGSNQINLTNSSGNDVNPAFSPDNTEIAYVSNNDDVDVYGIYKMNTDGSGKIKLASVGQSPNFSPDGKHIVFHAMVQNPVWNDEIFIMSADGSNKIRISDYPGSADRHDRNPKFSPDGSTIIFESFQRYVHISNPNPEIYTIRINDGNTLVKLSSNGFSPAFSPDGSKIAYLSPQYPPSICPEIQIMDITGGNNSVIYNNCTDYFVFQPF